MDYPGFVEEDDLKQALADTLKREVTKLQGYFTRIVALANRDAYEEIVTTLGTRSFSASVIENWDSGERFQLSLGLFWCGVHGAAHFQENEGELFSEFDRREELKTVGVTVDGVVQSPVQENGPIGHGRMCTGREVFRPLRRVPGTGRLR